MTTTRERAARDQVSVLPASRPPGAGSPSVGVVSWAGQHAVSLSVVLVVLLRLPMVARAPGLDEAGFLAVGQQWNGAGSSLYGNYWVDRPPLLISIFRAAAQLGGLVPLRLIGCLAAALTVLGVAHVAGRIAARQGDRARAASGWAAVVATAWCVSPLAGAAEVNGELLAAPFVVGGVAAALAAVWSPVAESRRSRLYAGAAGAATVGALMVKQNFVDVAVFTAALLVLGVVRGELGTRVAVRLAGAFAAGAAVTSSVIAAWTVLHGTSLGGVLYAMYPFRVTAGRVIAASGNPATSARLGHLVEVWGLSGMAVVTVLVLGAVVATRKARGTASVALVAMVVFAVLSIFLGGSFWMHYLVQLIVPLSVLAGVTAARRFPGARLVAGAVAVVAALSLSLSGALLPGAGSTEGSSLGRAVGAAALPGDTVVTLYGHSDVTQQSGLASPYPYLWSLPLKTLDPDLHTLDRVLSGPSAPTWVVTFAHVTSWGVRSGDTTRILARDYRVAAVLRGHTIYLRNDVERPTPTWPSAPPTSLAE